jgi:catechol 2,3-dioxygenase-like lactoylglutathione lyase family enzyme
MTGSTRAWAWHHTGFAVTDLDDALAFYRDTLGFEVVFQARGMTDLIQSVTGVPGLQADLAQCRSPMSGQVLEFIEFRNVPIDCDPMMPVWPGRAHTAYLVADLERAVAALVSAGGTMLGQVTEFAEGRAVYFADRTGAVVELEEAAPGTVR